MYIKREFSHTWSRPAQPVKFLVGPRQVGKSAFLEDEAKSSPHRFVTFDDLATREFAQRDPRQFLRNFGNCLIIDEAHYVPDIFPELKLIVDDFKRRRLAGDELEASAVPSYWLTGSNRVLLDQSVAESLTGRASYFRFQGLSVSEIEAGLGALNLGDVLMRGGWPELYTNPQLSPVSFLNDYISTSIEKDVAAIGVEKVAEFVRVLRFVAGRIGGIFDLSEVARDAGVKAQTVSGWLDYAVRMMILHRVDVFSTNVTTRLIKSPKYFFLDTGLAIRFQGWGQVEPLLVSPAIGSIFENLVLSEITKCRDRYLPALEISHWRTKEREEVDFVLSMNGRHLAIEAKTSTREANTVSMPKQIARIPALAFATVSPDRSPESGQSAVEHFALRDLSGKLRAHFG